MNRFRWIIACALFLHAHAHANTDEPASFRIAFIADAHFHDIYASFRDHSFLGIKSDSTGKMATIRTMNAQLMSTRLFNENYFALQAALDDLVQKGIRYVGLAGDFTDDGQPVHIRRLSELLDSYSRMNGMRFFAVPGNHDPGRPVDSPGGKTDFMGVDGREQRILSKSLENRNVRTGNGLPAIYTDEITPLGYDGIIRGMGSYGFFPQETDIYWATPYSSYDDRSYTYAKALEESALDTRTYEICLQGTGGKYKEPGYTNCFSVRDATYLVEPIQGVWLLAIDANVYLPEEKTDAANPENPRNFKGSGDAGYNGMVSHKKQVIHWISNVAKEAKKKGKTLITFSHFPMLDFYDGNAGILQEIFGAGQLDLDRLPTEETMKTMAATGVQFNIAGHLHFNDTGIRQYGNDFLVNIQVPSLAAYVPGYKILTVKSNDIFELETVEIKEMPRLRELFEHYRTEHRYLAANDPGKIWDDGILKSANYTEFTDGHLKELTRKRFLPRWPDELKKMLQTMTGKDIMIYTQLEVDIPVSALADVKEGKTDSPVLRIAWVKAAKNAQKIAKQKQIDWDDLENWNGFDLAVDFYRMMNADELALHYIKPGRIKEYAVIRSCLENNPVPQSNGTFRFYFSRLFRCLYHFSNAEPCNNVIIDFSKKEMIDLSRQTNRMMD